MRDAEPDHEPSFVDHLLRWSSSFLEYAQTWEQAMAGSGGHVSTKAEIEPP